MIFEMSEEQLAAFAEKAYNRGENDRALKFYQRLHHDHPNHWSYTNMVGVCFVRLGNQREARKYFRLSLEQNGLEETLVNNIGWSYNEEKSWEKAKAAMAPYVDKYPKDFSIQYNYANCLFGLEAYEEALIYFLRAKNIDKSVNRLFFSLGITYYALDNFSASIDHFIQYEEEEHWEDALYF